MLNSRIYLETGEHYHPIGQSEYLREELLDRIAELRDWLEKQETYISEGFGLPSNFLGICQKVSDAGAQLALAKKLVEYRTLGRDSNEAYQEALKRREAALARQGALRKSRE